MAKQALANALRYMRRLTAADGGDGQDDAQLLRRFVARRDEAAFATLLERHAALVYGVCRQVLHNAHDAEDAFQATFLVLARKAASVRRRESLAAWLYRVALNLARTARARAARRQAHEREAALMPGTTADDPARRDWLPVLHEEVGRLPEKYRVPVVLCYLQAKTHDEAARQLGWPLGTVKGRLARARDLLRRRLVRRGLALTTAALAAALAEDAAAAVPPALLGLTLRAALAFAAGGAVPGGATSAGAVTLAEGGLKTMAVTKLVLVLLVLSAAGGLGSLFVLGGADNGPPAGGTAPGAAGAPAPPPAGNDFGPEVKGLRARVTLPRDTFAVGEAVPVTYVVKNVSGHEQTLWHCGFWPNHQVLVRDAAGKEPPLSELGRQRRQSFAPGGERDKNVPVAVPPGGEDAAYEKYNLAALYDLSRPGRYTVQYVYEEKHGGWEGRLPSNQAGFEVVARKEREDAAESEAMRVEGLNFVAVVPKRVATPPAGGRRAFDLGLRVTNVTDKPVALSTFDVIRPRLYTAGGKELVMDGGRNGSPRPSPPVVLAPGASWTWRPEARLEWAAGDISILLLRGPDGRGVAGSWWFTLKEGKYRLAVEYANRSPKQGDVSLWVGKAVTREVEFEIVTQENRESREKPAAEPAEGVVKDDLVKLQGTWRLVAAEEGGLAVPPANFARNQHWVFSGKTGTFQSGLRGLSGTITLDPTKSPRWIDVTSEGGFVLQGIYELKGDRLRLFFVPQGTRRPTEFKTEKGTQLSIGTYERGKTDPK